jgi:hypothetical protein
VLAEARQIQAHLEVQDRAIGRILDRVAPGDTDPAPAAP